MRYLVLIAAVGLSACAGGEANNNVSNETPQDASPARTERTTDRSTDPVPATSPAQQVNISKAQLIGLKKDEILNLLGRPSFQRRDPPAEIWRYRTDECLVDLYLYPPKTSDTTKQKEVTTS